MSATDIPQASQPTFETNEIALRQAILRKVSTQMDGRCVLMLPALPALIEYYIPLIRSQWVGLGRNFTDSDLSALYATMLDKARPAFTASPFGMLRVVSIADAYPKSSISWTVECLSLTLEERYQKWVKSHKPPLFGQHADAKVMDLARSLGAPEQCPVLDAGAGSGRNTLPLARLGMPTDAVEITPALVKTLRKAVQQQKLKVRVFQGNILDERLPLPREHYRLILLSEVVSHFRSLDEFRKLFHLADQLLVPNGQLLFNCFVARDGYQPDDIARQVSQLMWSYVVTQAELREASAELDFELVSMEPACAFEKSRQPAADWPPTGWYEAWSAGTGLFDLPLEGCPMQLQWLVYRKPVPSAVLSAEP